MSVGSSLSVKGAGINAPYAYATFHEYFIAEIRTFSRIFLTLNSIFYIQPKYMYFSHFLSLVYFVRLFLTGKCKSKNISIVLYNRLFL